MSKAQVAVSQTPDTEAELLKRLAERAVIEAELADTRRKVTEAQVTVDRIMGVSRLDDKAAQAGLADARHVLQVGPARVAALERQLDAATLAVGEGAIAHHDYLHTELSRVREWRIQQYAEVLRPHFPDEKKRMSFAVRTFCETVQAEELAAIEAALKGTGRGNPDCPPLKRAAKVLSIALPTE